MKKVTIISNNLECDELAGYFSRLEKYFRINNWEISKDLNADLIIIVACGAIDLVYLYVKNALSDIYAKKGDYESTIIMGCQAITYRDKLQQIFDGRMIAYGEENILDEIICAKNKFSDIKTPNVYKFSDEYPNELFTIIISTGCLRRCTYCIINKAHGSIKSKKIQDICEEYAVAIKYGYKNVALSGTDTSVYGYDNGENIINLLDKLIQMDSTIQFYIENLHPHNLIKYKEEFIRLTEKNIFAYLHIPLQHVDDAILKKMGRDTVFSEIYDMVIKLKEVSPKTIIITDFIYGFPGETDAQFSKLLEFVQNDAYFDYYYIHDYSDIPGTASYNFKSKIREEEMKKRGLQIMVAFERRKKEKKSRMDSHNYRIFRNRYNIEEFIRKEKGYYICENTYQII